MGRRSIQIIFLSFLFFISPGLKGALAREVRVAIFPLTIHAKEDITYIREGIASLLPARIAVPGKIAVIDSYAVKNEFQKLPADHPLSTEVALGEKLMADFILTGSLVKMGSAIGLEARLVEISSPENAAPVSLQSLTVDDMLPQLTAFGEQVKKRILAGQEVPEEKPAPPVETKPAVSAMPVTAEKPAREEEKPPVRPPLILPPEPEEETPEQPPIEKKPPLFEAAPFCSLETAGEPLRCLTAGDVDGDGKKELFLSGEHRILVYQWVEGSPKLRNEIKAGLYEHFVHIDTGDFNRNGREEVYVSSFGAHAPNSFVVEWAGGSFIRLDTSQEWFFRTYQQPRKQLQLLGQKAGTVSFLSNTIFTFSWKNKKLVSRTEFLIPQSVSIYGFAEGDVNSDNEMEYVSFNKGFFGSEHQLTIFSTFGKILWQDPQKMGGDVNYFIKRTYGNDVEQQEYLPLRILCDDFNRDGRVDVIVAKNSTRATGIMEKIVAYDQGEVFCLHWDGSDLAPNWSTGLLNGYVTDYGVFDLDGDGKKELFVISVSETGLLGKTKNRLTAYRLAQPQ